MYEPGYLSRKLATYLYRFLCDFWPSIIACKDNDIKIGHDLRNAHQKIDLMFPVCVAPISIDSW